MRLRIRTIFSIVVILVISFLSFKAYKSFRGHTKSLQARRGFSDLVSPIRKLSQLMVSNSRAAPGDTVIDQIRERIFNLVGYPDVATNILYNGSEIETTLVSLINILDAVDYSFGNAGYTCASIPTTGTHIIADFGGAPVTLNLSVGGKTIPTGLTGAGATLAKRIDLSLSSMDFVIEFTCGGDVAYLAFEEPITSTYTVPATKKGIFWIDNVLTRIEEYHVSEIGGISYEGLVQILDYDEGTGIYDFWSIWAHVTDVTAPYAPATSTPYGFRYAVKGNATTGEASVFYMNQEIGAMADDLSNLVSADDTINNGPSTFDFQALYWSIVVGSSVSGCVDTNTYTVNPGSTAWCAHGGPDVLPGWSIDPTKIGSVGNLKFLSAAIGTI